MSDKCFKKCIYRPGTSLDSSEQVCPVLLDIVVIFILCLVGLHSGSLKL